MGQSSDQITANNAELVLASGTFAGQYGLIISAGGNFLVYGAAKTPHTTGNALGGGNITPATTQVSVLERFRLAERRHCHDRHRSRDDQRHLR